MNGKIKSTSENKSIIDGKVSGGILMAWLGGSFFLKEMSLFSGQLWWPVFSAGIGILLILRGVMIYESTKYWSNDKGAFIGGAFFIFLSLLSFVEFASLANWWPVVIVILGISISRRELGLRREIK
jgi:hypothetical protein